MKNFKTKNGIFTGNVGIGTTGPGAPLHIYHTAGDTLILEKSSTEPTIRMKGDANNDFVQTVAGTNFRICKHDGATSLLEIKQNGNVGIGATNPSHDLTLGSGVSTGSTSTRLKIYRGADDPGQNLEMGYGHITVTRSNVLASPQSTFSIKQKGSDGERIVMHIDTDGSVGIGTTSPSKQLHIEGTNANSPGIKISASDLNYEHEVRANGDGLLISADSTNYGGAGPDIRFNVSGSERMRIIQNGNVGIGTTNPSANLHIFGDNAVAGSQGFIKISNNVNGDAGIIGDSIALMTDGVANQLAIRSGSAGIVLGVGSSPKMTINSDGNVGIGTTSPDFALDLVVNNGGVQLQMGRSNTNAGTAWMGADSGGFHLGVGAYGTQNNVASPNGLTVDTGGNVGIGTTNPFGKLEVKGGASYLEGISLSPSSGGTVSEINSGSGTYGIQFKRGSSDTMTISSAGNVGIGSTDPGAYKLDVANSQTEFVQKISNGHSSSAYGLFVHLTAGHDNKTSEYIRCVTGNGNINFNVYSDGTIFADGASLGSDDRIKHNEEKIVNAVETLSKITPKKYFKTTKLYDANHDFDLNSDGSPIDESGEPVKHRVEAGVIAQEVLGVDELKFAVSPETKDENGNVTTPYALNYNSLFTYAIAAIQEQQQLIEDLKSRIETLES